MPTVALRASTCYGDRGDWHRKLPVWRCAAYWRGSGWRGGSLLLLLLLLLPGWEKGRREDASDRGTDRHTYGTTASRPPTEGTSHGPRLAKLLLGGATVTWASSCRAARVSACNNTNLHSEGRGGGRARVWFGECYTWNVDRSRVHGPRGQALHEAPPQAAEGRRSGRGTAGPPVSRTHVRSMQPTRRGSSHHSRKKENSPAGIVGSCTPH